jgi:hypothetical protein
MQFDSFRNWQIDCSPVKIPIADMSVETSAKLSWVVEIVHVLCVIRMEGQKQLSLFWFFFAEPPWKSHLEQPDSTI